MTEDKRRSERVDDVGVDHLHASLADGSHRQLHVPGHTELADDDHIHRRVECSGNFGSDGNATSGKAEHDRLSAGQVADHLGELTPGVTRIREHRDSFPLHDPR